MQRKFYDTAECLPSLDKTILLYDTQGLTILNLTGSSWTLLNLTDGASKAIQPDSILGEGNN